MPDATVEPLKQAGIRSKIKNHAKRPDVALVIMDEALYHTCEDVAGDILRLPKVHKYIDDVGLKEFLISKFGVLEVEETVKDSVVDVPVEDVKPEVVEEPVVEVPQATKQGVDMDFGATDIPYFAGGTSDADELERVKKELEQSKLLVSSLTKQIHNSDKDSDIPILVDKIKTLESQLKEANQKLEDERNASYMDKGKVARAEEIIVDLDATRKDLQSQREHSAKIEFEKQTLGKKLEEVTKSLKAIEEFPEKYKKAMEELDVAHKDYNEAYAQFESKCDEYDVLVKRYQSLEEKYSAEVEGYNKTINGLKADIENEKRESVVHSAEQDKELSNLRDIISAKDIELEQARQKIEALAKEVSAKETSAKIANENIERLNEEVASLKFDLEEARKSLGVKTEDAEKAQQEVSQLKFSLESVSSQLSELRTKLTKSDTEKVELQKKANETEAKLNSVITNLEESTKRVTSLREELAEKTESFAKLQHDLTGETSKAATYERTVAEKEAEIDRVSAELVTAKEEIIDLRTEKTKLLEQLSELDQLKARNEELSNTLNSANETISSLKGILSEKESELESEISRVELGNSNMSDLEQRLQIATDNLNKLRGVQKDNDNLRAELEKVKSDLATKSEALLTMRTEKSESEANAEKEYLHLTNELRDKEREIDRLEQEVALLKRGEDKDGKTADLRLKIVSLTEELQELKHKKDTDSSEELMNLRKELTDSRERCATLELDVVDRDEQLKEIMDSIFTQMLNCASFKYPLNTTLKVGEEHLVGFSVIGGGSSESNLYTYKALRSTCTQNPNKRILILDLSTDSYIDAEFKVAKVNTPIRWLQGSEPLAPFVANTCFKNVKVVSTGLAYMNTLALLLVDWEEKLRELKGVADLVLINVGSLDNIVSKIMFQSLASVMKGHVVVRATPINIRTTMLSLAGFYDLKNTEVVCMNFDKTSNAMYQKLAGKYKAKILTDNNGLGVE